MAMLEMAWLGSLSIVTILTFVIASVINFIKKIIFMPPGPWGLPVIGYVPWLSSKPCEDFVELGKIYGGIFSINLGGETVVVLNDWQTIKTTLIEQPRAFSGRPTNISIESLIGKKDVVFSEGEIWKKQRRLTIQCLKNIGVGKRTMENHILDLVQELVNELKTSNNQVQPINSFFFSHLLKANWKLISNHDATSNQTNLKQLEEDIQRVLCSLAPDNSLNVFPWLRFIPPNGFGFWKLMEIFNNFRKYLKIAIDSRMSHWQEGSEISLIDFYITEIKRKQAETSAVEPPFTVENLLGTVSDIFLAGLDTTNNTLQWSFLYLAYYPEVQKKAQLQLDQVVGRNRMPNLNDFSNLSYIDALIMEIHRHACIVPLSLPHTTTTTASVSGYTIPKGTTCLQNIYAVHRDPTLFEFPEKFQPERFLDKDNKIQAPRYLMPFSVGPRQCIGRLLADMELRLVISSLLHLFTFSLPPNKPKPSLIPKPRTHEPSTFSLQIQMREVHVAL